MEEEVPAFPQARDRIHTGAGWQKLDLDAGMSLRDYFAGQALIGLVTKSLVDTHPSLAERAYQYADAMLAARAKPPSPVDQPTTINHQPAA